MVLAINTLSASDAGTSRPFFVFENYAVPGTVGKLKPFRAGRFHNCFAVVRVHHVAFW